MTTVILPQFGMGMTDGTIIAWHKAPGDAVRRGEPQCDVEAAKTTIEVVSPGNGFLQKIIVPAGTNVPVNTPIAIFGDDAIVADLDDAVSADTREGALDTRRECPGTQSARPAPVAESTLRQYLAAPSTCPETRCGTYPRKGSQVEPRARRAARDHGIDLAHVRGTGPGGRIVEEDVLTILRTAQDPSEATATRAGSWPNFYQARMHCTAAPLANLVAELALATADPPSVQAIIAKAVALALASAGLGDTAIALRLRDTFAALECPSDLSLRAIAAGLNAPPATDGDGARLGSGPIKLLA